MNKQLEMTEAPTVGAVEASIEFVSRLKELAVTIAETQQVNQPAAVNDAIFNLEYITDQLSKVSTMVSMIARLSQDADITKIATHAKQMLSSLENDADCVRESISTNVPEV